MKILVVDDVRTFEFCPDYITPDTVVKHARTPGEAMSLLDEEHWDEVWLDHDMGQDAWGKEMTAMPIVKDLLKNPRDIERIYVHSMNPVGASLMVRMLGELYRAYRFPLGTKIANDVLVVVQN